MYYATFEIETRLDPFDFNEDNFKDKLCTLAMYKKLRPMRFSRKGKWFFKVYEDISCGLEFVTLPMPLGNDMSKIDDVAEDLRFLLDRIEEEYGYKARRDDFASISTHVTFTNDERRRKAMPAKYVKNAIRNMILWYAPALYLTNKYTTYPYTRSTYFRRYYVDERAYGEDKSMYPAVFIPTYDYHRLPPYHKIEFRLPDTMFTSPAKSIAKVLQMYVAMMQNIIKPQQFTKDELLDMNHWMYRALDERDLYNFDDVVSGSNKRIFNEVIKEFVEGVGL